MRLRIFLSAVALSFAYSFGFGQLVPATGEERTIIDSILRSKLIFLRDCLNAQNDAALSDKLLKNPDSLAMISVLQSEAVSFFEDLTGHKANVINVYAYGKAYSSREIVRWDRWVKKNFELLKWEMTKSRINRKDINIYND
jgi:hypothetical protein